PNRFDDYDTCVNTCNVTRTDPCLVFMDRGNWCEPMSDRFYYHKKRRACVGFHYTGCGQSRNNFKTLKECIFRCEKRHGK
ncbi:hypothetical protein PENTCL1PPCAC_8438, partial [Pristionchus entomophagus]